MYDGRKRDTERDSSIRNQFDISQLLFFFCLNVGVGYEKLLREKMDGIGVIKCRSV